jgi:hypothetical protein
MIPRNIFAFTPSGADMPPYLSINRVAAGVEIHVRSCKELGSATAVIALSMVEFDNLRAVLAEPQV